MARTYDAIGTLKSTHTPGQFHNDIPKFYIVGPNRQKAVWVVGDMKKINKWLNKFVYFRGCVERDGNPPVARLTYLGDDQITRDATRPC